MQGNCIVVDRNRQGIRREAETKRIWIQNCKGRSYLADRQQNPLYYLKGKRHNCIPYTPPQPYSSELGGAIRLAVEQEMSSLPDLLTEKQVCAILGYRPKQILDWKHSGKLIALKCFNKTYFPKIPLMDFVSSEDYYNLPCKGRKHIELLRRVQK